MQVFWDFVRHGFPVVGAVGAGLWANGRGMKSVSTLGVASAGWGAGWLAQFLIGKAVDSLSGERLPADVAAPIGLLPEMEVPDAQTAVTQIRQNAAVDQPRAANLTMIPGGAPQQSNPKPPPFDPRALGGESTD